MNASLEWLFTLGFGLRMMMPSLFRWCASFATAPAASDGG